VKIEVCKLRKCLLSKLCLIFITSLGRGGGRTFNGGRSRENSQENFPMVCSLAGSLWMVFIVRSPLYNPQYIIEPPPPYIHLYVDYTNSRRGPNS